MCSSVPYAKWRGVLSSLAKRCLYCRMESRSRLNRSLFLDVPENLGFLGVGRVNQNEEGERTLRDKGNQLTRIGEREHVPKDQEAHVVWGSVERREFLKIVGFREYDYEGLLRRLGPQYWGSQLGSFLSPTWHGGSIAICHQETRGLRNNPHKGYQCGPTTPRYLQSRLFVRPLGQETLSINFLPAW